MSMMNTELYDALISANVPEMKARKAAMSVLGYEQVAAKADFADIKADIHVLKWMVGLNIALTLGLLTQAII